MVLTALCALGCTAATAAPEVSGQVQAVVTAVAPSSSGPLAQAAQVSPGLVSLPASGTSAEAELRASGAGLAAVATLRQERLAHDRWRSSGHFNELYAAGGGTAWQFSAGRKIVAWDVGYGFRPNDVVQQEVRRALLASTAEGRPLLMAEHYSASTAWSAVLVNPAQPRAQRGPQEPALALRLYQRDGALDWHGFARWGAHTRGSLGAAVAWVAGEAVELHASLRALTAADTLRLAAGTPALAAADPWRPVRTGHTAQALVGGTWTSAEQLSLLAEVWWDGTALSGAQWRQWAQRNEQLAALIDTPAPRAAVAGNLAWQTGAYAAAGNLRRTSVYLRLGRAFDAWQAAADVLLTPADRGCTLGAWLSWQGDRVRVEGAWRQHGGPAAAILAQLPARRTAYITGTWAF
jgi:hypothetical protein